MSDNTTDILRNSMSSLVEIAPPAPDLPPLPVGRPSAHRTPIVVAATAFVAVIAVIGMATLVVPMTSGEPDTATVPPDSITKPRGPIVGSWLSDDLPLGTVLTLTITASGEYETWDEIVISGKCQGNLVTSSGTGEFDGLTFVTPGDNRICHPLDGPNSFPLPDGFVLVYIYYGNSDTLTLLSTMAATTASEPPPRCVRDREIGVHMCRYVRPCLLYDSPEAVT
jgi:hypothetical protein